MNDFTAPNQSKIDDRKWGCIPMNTSPFPIVDFRRFCAGQIVHFIALQPLIQNLHLEVQSGQYSRGAFIGVVFIF